MNKSIRILFIGLTLISLVACSKSETKNYAYKISFMEQEQFVEPYPTRMVITPEFIRFDDGKGSEDFILFDRKKSLVHSVISDEESVMTVHKKDSKVESPIKLVFSEKDLGEMKDAPEIGGERPRHYQLLVNDKVCHDVIAVKTLMPLAVKALKEFSEIMASDSKMTLSNIPADMINACDLAQDTFAASRQLMFGFPLQTMGRREYARTLIDFDLVYKLEDKVFELPEKYKRYSVQELREGKVKFGK